MQESSLQFTVSSSGGDLGMFQLSPRTRHEFNFDSVQLLSNVHYAVTAHALVLRSKLLLPQCKGPTGWSCYHSFTPDRRREYEKAVQRWFPDAHSRQSHEH